MSLKNFIQNNSVLRNSEELIFFGGSFNPWHAGHTSCLLLAPDNWPIIVIPDHNPFKDFVGAGNKVSSLTEIQAHLAKIKNTTYLFDEFLREDKKNPSHKWIAQIKKEYPNKKISLLMGFDTYISIDRWIKAKKVLNDLHALYIASRLDNEDVKHSQREVLHKINPELVIDFLGHHEHEELSSTKIRNERTEH